MTEASEDDFLVTVRAQVMARDESTEGWLPLQGGGLANVSIRKRARLPPDGGGHEYIIYGQRIADQTVILSCVINRDLQYYKVMPTFHHWRAGKQRNGLTFQTAADARAFDKGIIRAYDDLIDGMADYTVHNKYNDADKVGEDDVFMTLDLPLEPCDSRSNSEGSGSHRMFPSVPPVFYNNKVFSHIAESVDKQSQQQQSTIQYISGDKPSPLLKPGDDKVTPIVPGDNYSYVQITDSCDIKLKYNFYNLKPHEYNYPVVDEPVGSILSVRRDSTSSLKKRNALDVPPMKEATLIKARLRCRYCQEFYNDEYNHKGSCDYAPDCFKTAIENVSGMFCARCMLYHCMKDAEGETASHPCSCTGESGCTKRWIGLALLSLLVPCLWCYPPLRACHWVGVSCRLCGGKHKPQI